MPMMRPRTVAVEFSEAEAFVEMMRRIRDLKGLTKGWNGDGWVAPNGLALRVAERFAKDRQSMATRMTESATMEGCITFEIAAGDPNAGQGSATVTIDRKGKPFLTVGDAEAVEHDSVSGRKFRKALDDAISPRGGRFGNIKRYEVEGIVFHSPIEAKRYVELRQRERLGELSDLARQVPYRFDEAGRHCFTYLADFVYVIVATGETVVEDVKGMPTDIYRLKKKLIEARFGIEISEWPISKKELERRAKVEEKLRIATKKADDRRIAIEARAAKKALEDLARAARAERQVLNQKRPTKASRKPNVSEVA